MKHSILSNSTSALTKSNFEIAYDRSNDPLLQYTMYDNRTENNGTKKNIPCGNNNKTQCDLLNGTEIRNLIL